MSKNGLSMEDISHASVIFTKHGIFHQGTGCRARITKSQKQNALTRQDNLTQIFIKMWGGHLISSTYKVAIPLHWYPDRRGERVITEPYHLGDRARVTTTVTSQGEDTGTSQAQGCVPFAPAAPVWAQWLAPWTYYWMNDWMIEWLNDWIIEEMGKDTPGWGGELTQIQSVQLLGSPVVWLAGNGGWTWPPYWVGGESQTKKLSFIL